MYDAEDRKEAMSQVCQRAAKWKLLAPQAVLCLREGLEELLQVYTCPREIRIKPRATHVIARAFQEVRGRTGPMSSFRNVDSIERIVHGGISHQNDKLGMHPLNEITQRSWHYHGRCASGLAVSW